MAKRINLEVEPTRRSDAALQRSPQTPGFCHWFVRIFGVMCDHTFYKQVQISGSDIGPHRMWAVSLVILHTVTSIFLRGSCGYIYGLTCSLHHPRGGIVPLDKDTKRCEREANGAKEIQILTAFPSAPKSSKPFLWTCPFFTAPSTSTSVVFRGKGLFHRVEPNNVTFWKNSIINSKFLKIH